MTTLTTEDYKWCVDWIKVNPTHRETLKHSGLDRVSQLFPAIQALEDYHVSAYNSVPNTTIKATIEAATSASPTLAQNKVMWYAWSAWKARQA